MNWTHLKNDKDSCLNRDNEEQLWDNHAKDEETLNTHTSAHIRESIVNL